MRNLGFFKIRITNTKLRIKAGNLMKIHKHDLGPNCIQEVIQLSSYIYAC